MTAEDAEEVIQGRADAQGLESFVTERVDELAVGIERAIAFITAQSGGEGVDQVYLSGGGARVPGVVGALGERLGVSTHLANPLERVAVKPEVNMEVAVDEVAPMLMLPVGLAMRRA
jgi:type IV pilus assembly protein PilM